MKTALIVATVIIVVFGILILHHRAKIQNITGQNNPVTTQSTSSQGSSGVKSIQVLVPSQGGRENWSSQNIIAYSKFSNGKLGAEIYTINPDGTNQVCLTCGKTQISHISNDLPNWIPDGKYVLFQSVDPNLYNSVPSVLAGIKDQLVEGGAGIDNNLWVVTADGSNFYQLTHINQGDGVLHAHFSPDGKRLFWAAHVQSGKPGQGKGGQWMLKIADFVDDASGPHLANERIYQPLGTNIFYESHEWFPDGQSVLFSSSANPTANQAPACACALSIYKMDVSTGNVTALTNTRDVWNEHAHITADGKKIAWLSSQGYPFTPSGQWAKTLKLDLWVMNPDGSNKQQLTFFNVPGNPQYNGNTVILADGSWNPTGDRYVVTKAEYGQGQSSSKIIVITFATF